MKRRQGYSCRRFMSFLWGWGIAGVWRGARLLLRPCGSGFFSPAEDGRALYVHAELGGFGEYAPRQCGFLRFGCIAEIGFRRADVLGVDEREFARFGDSERRCGEFAAFFDGEPVGSFGFRSHDGVVFLSGRQNPGQRSGVCLRGGVPTACEWLSVGRVQSSRAIRLPAAYRPGPAIQSSAKAARQSMFDAFVWFSQIDGLSLRP